MPLAPVPAPADQQQVTMRTLSDCRLAVSIYPTFSYDAAGGGGVSQITNSPDAQRLALEFDASTLSIPDVSYATAKILGVPLFPIFQIAIDSQKLTGFLERASGMVELEFVAQFNFTVSVFGRTLYAAPPLLVTTLLTTETAAGTQLSGTGRRLDSSGSARLAGVARVPPTGDYLFDSFLRLPADTLAVMSSTFEFFEK